MLRRELRHPHPGEGRALWDGGGRQGSQGGGWQPWAGMGRKGQGAHQGHGRTRGALRACHQLMDVKVLRLLLCAELVREDPELGAGGSTGRSLEQGAPGAGVRPVGRGAQALGTGSHGHCPTAWPMLPQGRQQEGDLAGVGVMPEKKSSPWERGRELCVRDLGPLWVCPVGCHSL